jgi:hydroxymethylbilane synthase
MTAEPKIVIGTRGSELARAQAGLVEKAIQSTRPELMIEPKVIATRGDQTQVVDRRAGWKGLFTAEIEKALLAGDVDLAVHSAKDLPSEANAGTEIFSVLPRASTADILISKHAGGLADLPTGATIGTSSIRRTHQLMWQRPDVSIVDLRGNVPTRLRKLAESNWDAIVLARAGVDRLGLSTQDFVIETLPLETFLPAGGQGIIAIQIRAGDERVRSIVGPVNHNATLLCLRAEREFLRLLNVDCNAPVGVLAMIDNGVMKMRAQFFRGDSAAPHEGNVEGKPESVELLAAQLRERLRPGE